MSETLKRPSYNGTTPLDQLKAACAFKMQVHHPDYAPREIVAAGEGFYDVMLGWAEPDGSVIFTDIGGQKAPGWNPEEGHGSIWWLRPDDRLEAIVPPGNMNRWMPLALRKAPASFGPWGDQVFFTGQTEPGRPGATKPHAVFHLAPGADRPELFVVVPPNGRVGGGMPGSVMPGPFGRDGTPFEGQLFVMSFMNCTIYRVYPDGRCEPFITLDGPEGTIMPTTVAYAPPWWGDLAGELILFGPRGVNFESPKPLKSAFAAWRILPDGKLDPIGDPPTPLRSAQAPPEFGPYAGDIFFVDEGPVNLALVSGCDEYADGLPYTGRVLRKDRSGQVHVFADNFQGSSTSLVFQGQRLLMGLVRLSYCTGECHDPDSSIYEIRYTGPS